MTTTTTMTSSSASASASADGSSIILEGLYRLSESLKNDLNDQTSSPTLSHYQEIPNDIEESYHCMLQGATLVHATATKYTLLGKLSLEEASTTVSPDLLRGCQYIATGAMVIGMDHYGCCRSTRFHVKRAARAVVSTTLQLIQAFEQQEESVLDKDSNVAAQKCGAVWSTCDVFLQKQLPRGNRNAMRRDLFTWMMDCNETMQEFQQLIDNGPGEKDNNNNNNITTEDNNNSTGQDDEEATSPSSFEDFLLQMGTGNDQYTAKELGIAIPCVALVKCSRGAINVALKACDAAGKHLTTTSLNCNNSNDTIKDQLVEDHDNKKKNQDILQFINRLHDMARAVGEGMTDLGTLLYPTLSLEDIEKQGLIQKDSIVTLLDFVLDATTTEIMNHFDHDDQEIVEMIHKIRPATELRHQELTHALLKHPINQT
jgi:Grap2 and cyclin-D-interacting